MSIILKMPWWVFLVFFYLLYAGLAATRPRVVWIPKLFIIPIVLMSFKIQDIFSADSHILLSYLSCSLLGYYMGYRQVRNEELKIIKPSMSLKLKGSWNMFVILMSFFCFKCVFGFMTHEMPELIHKYRALELCICGIFSWYFFGRAVGYLIRYKKE